MGESAMAIHRKSYLIPNQKEGANSKMLMFFGLKKITVAMRKTVNMQR